MKSNKHSKRKGPMRTGVPAGVTCKEATDLIGDYVADNLTSPERRAFEAHLSGCPDCKAFLATYKRTIGLTQSFLAAQLQAAPVELKLRLPAAC
jgi:anti-sigma factor RsiW